MITELDEEQMFKLKEAFRCKMILSWHKSEVRKLEFKIIEK